MNETYSEFVLAEYPTTKERYKLLDYIIAMVKSAIRLEEVVPHDEYVEVVQDKIKGIDMLGRTRTEQALLAACCFRYPYLKEHNRLNEYEELFRCVEYLVMQNEDVNFVADVGKTFIDIVYKWQERTRFHNAYELPNIEVNVIEHIDEVFLFDDKYFYMKESLFATIVCPLLDVFPLDVLKSTLDDDGIFMPGK